MKALCAAILLSLASTAKAEITAFRPVTVSSLNATGVAAGTYGSATRAPQFTVQGDGRLTSAADLLITPAAASITSGSLGAAVIASSLSATGVTAGTYGSATQIPQFTVGGDGRLSAATSFTISAGSLGAISSVTSNTTQFTGDGTNVANKLSIVAVSSSLITGTLQDPQVRITTGGVVSGVFSDNRVGITTGGVVSGIFSDNRVNITTGGVTSGAFSDNRVGITTGGVVSGAFSDNRVGITTGAVISGRFNDVRVGITTGALISGVWQDATLTNTRSSSVTFTNSGTGQFSIQTSSSIKLTGGGIVFPDGSIQYSSATGSGSGASSQWTNLFTSTAAGGQAFSIAFASGGVMIGGLSPPRDVVDMSSAAGSFYPPQGTNAQRPSNAGKGACRYNTTSNLFECNNGTNWDISFSSTTGYCAASGGVITVVAGQCIHTFTSTGTFFGFSGNVEALVVGGGGGSGSNNAGTDYGVPGGGGCGIRHEVGFAVSASSYSVAVGTGGLGGTVGSNGSNGGNSIFSTLVAIGGGAGAGTVGEAGQSGGSGGGGIRNVGSGVAGAGGSGIFGQGFSGGNASTGTASDSAGGGGGGAGARGSTATFRNGGNGGDGLWFSISGTSTAYCGGGGGSGPTSNGTGGAGGGGGAGATGGNGVPNTGGGGGGPRTSGIAGSNGGTGIVIISYPAGTLPNTLNPLQINNSGAQGSVSATVFDTMTITGNAFSVGGSSFTVSGGTATIGFGLGIRTANPLSGLDVNANATIRNHLTVVSTVTVQDNAFSVGGSSFTVSGGTATIAYQASVGSLKFVDGSSMTSVTDSSSTYGLGTPAAAQTSYGVCTSSLVVSNPVGASNSNVLLSFSGVATASSNNSNIGANVLRNGSFLPGFSSTLGMTMARVVTAGFLYNLSFSLVVPGTNNATDTYCISSKASAGNFTFDTTNSQNNFSVTAGFSR